MVTKFKARKLSLAYRDKVVLNFYERAPKGYTKSITTKLLLTKLSADLS